MAPYQELFALKKIENKPAILYLNDCSEKQNINKDIYLKNKGF